MARLATKRVFLLGLITAAVTGAVFLAGGFLGRGRPRHPGMGVRPEVDGVSLRSDEKPDEKSGSGSLGVEEVADKPEDGVVLDSGWTRFRGPNGAGISSDVAIPQEWSEKQNLRWSLALPGPGSSSPIVTPSVVFVTCYTGIEGESRGGSLAQLKRHLLCIDRKEGKLLWSHEEPAVQPEDAYQGMGVPEHGYATNTPVTDGKRVYVFFGKSGVLAFDMSGKKLWQSRSIRALNAATGEEVWKATGAALELAYGTPILAKVDAQRTDLVIAVPGEVWGLNPRTGKLTWYAETSLTGNLSPSLILDGDVVIAFGGYRSSGSVAIKIGGKGDVTKTHTVWTSRNSSYVSTPVLVGENLYWLDDRGTYYVSSAKTGELVQRSRVSNITSRDRPVYASAIAVADRIFLQTRFDGLLVAVPGSELNILAQNRFESDSSMCNATPAVDNGDLFLRSDAKLYCVRATNP